MSGCWVSRLSAMFVCHSVIVLIFSSITFRSTQCGGQRDDPSSSLGRGERGRQMLWGIYRGGRGETLSRSLMTSGGINQVFMDYNPDQQSTSRIISINVLLILFFYSIIIQTKQKDDISDMLREFGFSERVKKFIRWPRIML